MFHFKKILAFKRTGVLSSHPVPGSSCGTEGAGQVVPSTRCATLRRKRRKQMRGRGSCQSHPEASPSEWIVIIGACTGGQLPAGGMIDAVRFGKVNAQGGQVI